MATPNQLTDEEALKLLRGGSAGIKEWNRRRKALEEIPTLSEADLSRADLYEARLVGADRRRANLSGADLRGADLSNADLSSATLYRAHLSGANLSEARLNYAALYGADLSGANLLEARLHHADLMGAVLSEADLSEADLTWARFWHAKLSGAKFEEATCLATHFHGVDLSEARGLESIIHDGPSSVDTSTLYKSKGRIPRQFLEGCGVPDGLIEHLPALIGAQKPIQFYSCFISHSSKDAEFCHRLFSRMRDEQLRVWYAPEHMKGGRKTYEQLQEAIRVYDKLLLVLSPESMASEWVASEIRWARKREVEEKRRLLFPIGLVDFETIRKWTCFDADTGKDLAVEVREYHIPDFSNWKNHDDFEKAFGRLLEDLKAEAGAKP